MADSDEMVKALRGMGTPQPETYEPVVQNMVPQQNFWSMQPPDRSNETPAFQTAAGPITTEDINRAMNVGMSAGPGIIAGKNALTANIPALIEANKMRMMREPMGNIRDETGWYHTPTDSKWKFEIPDTNAKINTMGALDWSQHGNAITGPAKSLLQHPDLYKAYPNLGELRTTVTAEPNRGGSFFSGNEQVKPDPKTSHLELMGPDAKNVLAPGLHEMQHAVQGIENFSRGGNPSYFALLQEKYPQNLHPDLLKQDPYELYRKLAGEVEARNVDARARYPSHQAAHPWETQEYGYDEQIPLNPSMSLIRALKYSK